MSIFKRIMISPLLLTLLFSIAFVVFFLQSLMTMKETNQEVRNSSEGIRETYLESIRPLVTLIEEISFDPLINEEPDVLSELLVRLKKYEAVTSAIFVDADENILADGISENDSYGKPLDEAIRVEGDLKASIFEIRGDNLVYSKPFLDQGDPLGRLQIIFSLSEIELIESKLLQSVKELTQSGNLRALIIVIFAVTVIIIALVFSVISTKKITVDLKALKSMIEELNRGNLDSRLNMERNDEIGAIASSMDQFADDLQMEVLTAFQRLAEGDFTFEAHGLIKEPLAAANLNLIEIMKEINLTGDKVSLMSDSIASSGNSLAQGVLRQTSTLENTRKSIEIISSQTKQNAENSKSSKTLVVNTSQLVEDGNRQMQQMLEAMEEINTSSLNVAKIIKVIDEIAFQTNLLALNAAVEAARAGKYGKGFAVVADEVRKLSQRSADAAKETNLMIENAVSKVDTGVKIAQGTSDSLSKIVTSIQSVSEKINDISEASDEQTKGIQKINSDLSQLSNITEENTRVAEENEATSEELTSRVNELKQLVANFRLVKSNEVHEPGLIMELEMN